MTLIRVAHSPDSDDAFMFYALAKELIDTGELRFKHVLSDIESLNREAFEGTYEVTAVSIHAYAHLDDRYALLGSGASMGDGYGPVLVARETVDPEGLSKMKVALPGRLTSASLALKMWNPALQTVTLPFDEIMPAVSSGEVDAGVVIHEGQLTWQDEGFHKIVDLGVWWAEETGGLPLPLGGNVIRRDLGE
jgi:1,4-dihydroxy-6-naphthoate synthase